MFWEESGQSAGKAVLWSGVTAVEGKCCSIVRGAYSSWGIVSCC
jgi:hypothetical protein